MTTNTPRPRRSVLYMPGANDRALEKAKTLAADALILDLEDSVAPDGKAEARALVADKVKAGGYGKREVVIRINGLDTPWGAEDMAAAVAAGPDAILAPKVNEPAMVHRLSEMMMDLGAPQTIGLWAMMETPIAMLRAKEIAETTQSPEVRLQAFVMGTNDLAKELFCAHTPDRLPMLTSLSLCLLAGRAFGLSVIDGVHNAIKDMEGFEAVCVQGQEMGFDGKTLIHPSQIEPCNRIFRPSAEEVTWSEKIIAAFDLPENAGKGVVTVDGKMVELLHAENARRVVAVNEAIKALEGQGQGQGQGEGA